MCGFVTDFISDVFEGVVDVVEEVVGVVEDVVVGVVDVVVDVVDEVISWVAPQPEVPEFTEEFEEQQARGILVNKFTANGHIPIVYGTRKVGGNVVFLETSGTDKIYSLKKIVLHEFPVFSWCY